MAKFKSKGAILKYAATATPTTEVAQILGLSLEDGDRNLLDSTTHDNTTAKSYLDSGLRDTRGIGLRILLDPADTIHELLRSHQDAGTTGYAAIVLPDTGAAQWTGPVQVVSYQVSEMTAEGLLEANLRLKFLSVETFTA